MEKSISYACLYASKHKSKYYYEPVQAIFYSKNSSTHITPKDVNDYNTEHKYYVLLNYEEYVKKHGSANIKGKILDEAFIICLGVSELDVRNKSSHKHKRLVMPKKLTSSSESNYEGKNDKESEIQKSVNLKICKKINQSDNSERTLLKYKQSVLMNTVEPLNIDVSTSDKTDISKGQPFVLLNNDTNLIKKISTTISKEPRARKSFPTAIPLSQAISQQTASSKSCEKIFPSSISLPSTNISKCDIYSSQPSTSTTSIPQKNFPERKSSLTGVKRALFQSTDQGECSKAKVSCSDENLFASEIVTQSSEKSVSPSSQTSSPQCSKKISLRSSPISSPESSEIEQFSPLRSISEDCRDQMQKVNDQQEQEPDDQQENQEVPDEGNHQADDQRQEQDFHDAEADDQRQQQDFHDGEADDQRLQQDFDNAEVDQRIEPEVDQGGGREDEGDDSNDDVDETVCEFLLQYKRKLYKMYKKKNFDLTSADPELHERYAEVGKKVYLGLDVFVGIKSWRITKAKRYKPFLRDLGLILWTRKALKVRYLNINNLRSATRNENPQLCSPKKVDLFLRLYNDYLNDNPLYNELPQEQKDLMIQRSTGSLSDLLRDSKLPPR